MISVKTLNELFHNCQRIDDVSSGIDLEIAWFYFKRKSKNKTTELWKLLLIYGRLYY